MVLLSALASIEFFNPELMPHRMPKAFVVIQVPADGMCFWFSMWLAVAATPDELHSWSVESKNKTGIPSTSVYHFIQEKVKRWALSLESRSAKYPMPEEARTRIQKEHSAEWEDIEPRLFTIGQVGSTVLLFHKPLLHWTETYTVL